jgi:predicted nucleotidyltransferase
MSTETADQVVADTVEAARAVFGAEIEAVYALGSLAHGGFAPLVSDVDIAIVLGSTGPDTADRIATVQRPVVERASSPLAERLSVFWADWHAVRTGEGDHFRLGPVDRLDLLDSGRLLLGSDLRGPSVRPSHEDLVLMSADLILSKFTERYLEQLRDTEDLVAGGPRAVTKAVLFPVRFMYTLRTGRIGLNDGSARWYAAEGLPGSALALKALKWRNDGIGDVDLAVQMVDADLATLHAECLAEYAKTLDGFGEAPRAAALAERAGCVHLLTPDAR